MEKKKIVVESQFELNNESKRWKVIKITEDDNKREEKNLNETIEKLLWKNKKIFHHWMKTINMKRASPCT